MTSANRIEAGNPPRVEMILIPPTSAKLTITQATTPTVIPQVTLMTILPSGFSGEIPVELIAAIAVVLESAEVTKQMIKLMT